MPNLCCRRVKLDSESAIDSPLSGSGAYVTWLTMANKVPNWSSKAEMYSWFYATAHVQANSASSVIALTDDVEDSVGESRSAIVDYGTTWAPTQLITIRGDLKPKGQKLRAKRFSNSAGDNYYDGNYSRLGYFAVE